MREHWEKIREQMFDPFNFNVVTNPYTIGGQIKVEKGCNSFTVTNVGDVIVDFNGELLFPSATPLTVSGDSISYGGNKGEVYVGVMILKFVAPTVGVAPQVRITQKFYTQFQ